MGLICPNYFERTTGRLRDFSQPWHVYAAFAPSGHGSIAQVKVGISKLVIQRIMALQTGCPFVIKTTLHAAAGSRSVASKIECAVHAELEGFSTSGEWFEIDLANHEHKRRFHDATRGAYWTHAERSLEWQKLSREQVRAFAAARAVLTKSTRRATVATVNHSD